MTTGEPSIFERHPGITITVIVLALFFLFTDLTEIALGHFTGLGNRPLFTENPHYGFRLKPDNAETSHNRDLTRHAKVLREQVIGHPSIIHPDYGDRHSFAVDDGRFEVVDGALKLRDGVSLDREAATQVTVNVIATDGGGLSYTESFTITVNGTSAGETIEGTAGSDRLIGTSGNDTLNGFAGNDVLMGGAGDDVLDGGPGDDVLDGGAGNDTASYASSAFAVNADLAANKVTSISVARDGDLYYFFDDFESYSNTNDIVTDSPGNWGTFQNTDKTNNVIELSTAQAQSGTQSVRFFKPTTTSTKAGLIKGEDGAEPFSFGDGDIVSMIMYYYIPDGSTNPWPGKDGNILGPRLWDMESSNLPGQGGIRIGWNGRDTSVPRLDRNKIDLPNTDADIRDPWPRDEWFKLEMRVKLGVHTHDGYDPFDEGSAGWIQWIVNDTIILERSASTIPDTNTVYDRFTVGITISRNNAEVWLDDVTIREVTGSFVEADAGHVPTNSFTDMLNGI